MDFISYQKAARSTAIYPNQYRIMYPALGLCGESGEVAEKVKKLFRDSNGVLTTEKRQELKKEIGDVLWYCANLAADLDLELNEIATANIEKLQSRKERGVLKGSGDNR